MLLMEPVGGEWWWWWQQQVNDAHYNGIDYCNHDGDGSSGAATAAVVAAAGQFKMVIIINIDMW